MSKSLIEKSLQDLICFRVSQINGCAYCLDMHAKDLLAAGENAQRLFVMDAWREFREQVWRGNSGSLVLFLLMQIVLAIAVGIGQMLIGCVTCCIGFLPYIGTVITLPLVIFRSSYPLYFLQQFSPRYTIIREELPPPPGGFPVIQPGGIGP